MNLSLRTKLLAALVVINLCSSLLLGFSMYNQSMNMFLSEFRNSKLTFAKYVASLLSGEDYKDFFLKDSFSDKKFYKVLKKIEAIKKNEPSVKYVYALKYDSQKDELYYAIDTGKAKTNTIWIESELLSLIVYLDKTISFEYREKLYDQKAKLKDLNNEIVELQVVHSKDYSSLFFDQVELLRVLKFEPIEIQTMAGVLNSNNSKVKLKIPSKGKTRELLVTLTEKGQQTSEYGLQFIENSELKDKLKKLIRTKTDYVEFEPIENSYGSFLSAYAVVKIENDEPVGIVVAEISEIEISNFRNKFLIVAISTSFLVFIITLIVSILLSKYFTAPLEALSKAVESLASGNLETYLEIPNKDEFGKLANIFNIMVKNLKTASEIHYNLLIEISQLNENLEQKVKERTKKIEEQSIEIEKQIQATQKIQVSLLPDAIPKIQNAEVSFQYHPMMEVGGDFLDLDYRNDELRFFVCDVSGHGIPAAFLATMVKMALQESFELSLPPIESLMKIYGSLKGKMKNHFLSAAFCSLDLKTGNIRYANAGHLPPIIIPNNGNAEFFPIRGRIISDLFSPNFEEKTIQLNPNDKIFLYTDGIIEARNLENEMFGERRLLQIINSYKNLSPKNLCEVVYSELTEFSKYSSNHFADDVTLLAAEYKP